MSSKKNYDDLLFPILHNEGDIFGFYDRIFEFLYRRTDFFKIRSKNETGFGLLDGEAEKIVRFVFCKYMDQAVSDQVNFPTVETEPVICDYIAEETVVTSPGKEDTPLVAEKQKSDDVKEDKNVAPKGKRDEDKSDAKIPVMDPDSYNGGTFDGYSWAQTLKDIDVRIEVPNEVTSGKQVRVDIKQNHLKVQLLVENEWTILKDEDLKRKVNVEESAWTLVPREHIHICLQKLQKRWWESFFVSEPSIDLKAIDPSIAYHELDRDTQVQIEELLHKEHLKRTGKPIVQNPSTKMQDLLKQCWDKEGSPFKGQPFDPTVLDIQNSVNLT